MTDRTVTAWHVIETIDMSGDLVASIESNPDEDPGMDLRITVTNQRAGVTVTICHMEMMCDSSRQYVWNTWHKLVDTVEPEGPQPWVSD